MAECPLCQGTRHVLFEDCYIPCTCLVTLIQRTTLLKAGVDISFFDEEKVLDSFKPNGPKEEATLAVTKELVELASKKALPRQMYCYTGESGVGKSFLIYFVIKAAVSAGYRCKVLTLQNLFQSYINAGKDLNGTVESGLDKYMMYDILVIDTGREVWNKLLGSVLAMVTKDRRDRGLYTMFASMYRRSDFLATYSRNGELDGVFDDDKVVKYLDLGKKAAKRVVMSPEEVWANKAID